ncbi:MAG: GrpB family protein [Peptococcaceae bacterium]|nr:GrpB family protein [Peptococcaceae bacterium]
MEQSLSKMSLEELWQLFPIVLREHNPQYAVWYQEEQAALRESLKECGLYRINHIGSTAVEGLMAKPIVDILLELSAPCQTSRQASRQAPCPTARQAPCPDQQIPNTEAVATILETQGWTIMARDDVAHTLDLNKGYTPLGFAEKVYHLHIKPAGDWDELYFRDYLRGHAETARAYEQLKSRLKEQFEHNRDAYTDAKSDFVRIHTQAARAKFGGRYRPGVHILKVQETAKE